MKSQPPEAATELPFPTSLCHRCAAPPRYITTARGSVFIMCPLLPSKYPPQPVRSCPLFRQRPPDEVSIPSRAISSPVARDVKAEDVQKSLLSYLLLGHRLGIGDLV